MSLTTLSLQHRSCQFHQPTCFQVRRGTCPASIKRQRSLQGKGGWWPLPVSPANTFTHSSYTNLLPNNLSKFFIFNPFVIKILSSEVDGCTGRTLFGKPGRLGQGEITYNFHPSGEIVQILEFVCVNFPLQGLTSLDPDVAQLVHRTGAGLPNKPIFSSTRFCLQISGHTLTSNPFTIFKIFSSTRFYLGISGHTLIISNPFPVLTTPCWTSLPRSTSPSRGFRIL